MTTTNGIREIACGVTLIIGVASSLAACERRAGESAGSAPPTSATSASVTASAARRGTVATTTLMGRHEILALQTRDALTRGDLKSTARFARDLARVRMSPREVDFGERLMDMHIASMDVAEAAQSGNRDATATAFGVLARSCSDCHARLTGPTRLGESGDGSTPSTSAGSSARQASMRRHAFAMDRLWDGLVFNTEAPWREGAAILSNRALVADELLSGAMKKTAVPEVEQAARSIGDLGQKAGQTSDVGERSRLIGALVSACAACHERIGEGGGGQPAGRSAR